MKIYLYQNSSPNNYIIKTLTSQLVLDGSLRDASSIINPSVLIEHDNPNVYNYLYIPEFKRYYYINNITSVRNKLWRLDCHVDVLNSFRSEILAHQAIIEKQNALGQSNLYYDDGDFVIENRQYVKVYNFPEGLDTNGEYILITAGAIAG